MTTNVSPKTFELQVAAWKSSIEESQKQGDLAEAARKQDILDRVLSLKARFEGYPRSALEPKP